jgi:(p)ppGpp synthase/HD superfamily hydrolase
VTAYLPGTGAVEVAIATESMEGENSWGVIYAINNNQDIRRYRPVQILTPFGGTRFLQEGSTVLDGVAAIQEFYLDKIHKVLVNGEERHLYDTLNPGDVVEVLSGEPHKTPEPDWLNHCNASTARMLRNVLAMVNLKAASRRGRDLIHNIISARGILDLDDVRALDPNRIEALLGLLACATLDNLYAAIGGGSISLEEFENALELVGISRTTLRWTSLRVEGPEATNRPGGLAFFAGLIWQVDGNILRTVSSTSKNGDFRLRMILSGIEDEQRQTLMDLFNASHFQISLLEIT